MGLLNSPRVTFFNKTPFGLVSLFGTLGHWVGTFTMVAGVEVATCSITVPPPVEFKTCFTRCLAEKGLSGSRILLMSVQGPSVQDLVDKTPGQSVIVLHGLPKINVIEEPRPTL